MMRELTSHKVNGLNDSLDIKVLDEPGAGNACHHYQIAVLSYDPDGSVACYDGRTKGCDISFQNGPINEAGVNGISNEALLAIVEDRLKGFQSGQYACRENQMALDRVQEAMHWLHHRTRERVARGVEGTHQK